VKGAGPARQAPLPSRMVAVSIRRVAPPAVASYRRTSTDPAFERHVRQPLALDAGARADLVQAILEGRRPVGMP